MGTIALKDVQELPQFSHRGNGIEAAEVNGTIYWAYSHYEALCKALSDILKVPLPDIQDREVFDAAYNRMYQGGDLYKKIRHGWYNRDYGTFAWDYYFGE